MYDDWSARRWTNVMQTYNLMCKLFFFSQVSQELSEAILTMVANANILMNKTRPVGPAGMGPKPTIPNIGPTLGNPVGYLIHVIVLMTFKFKFKIVAFFSSKNVFQMDKYNPLCWKRK